MSKRKVLLVIDPSKRDNNALERIGGILKRLSSASDFEVVTLITTNLDGIKKESSSVSVNKEWIDELIDTIAKSGQKYSIEVSWARDWADTLLEHIEKHETNFSILPFYDHRAANTLSDQKWKFLRNTKTPVLLTNGRREDASNIILAAIKTQDPDYEKANQKVLNLVAELAKRVGSEIHIVNAYDGSLDYPDRGKILQMTNIDNERVHIEEGSPKKVLRDLAKKLNADAIYIANNQHKGITARLRGNTVEKILEATDCDIVMV